jgi:CRISPR-associated protein Csb2
MISMKVIPLTDVWRLTWDGAVENPPHTARLIAALVNSWALMGEPELERETLGQLLLLGDPTITTPKTEICQEYITYVPVAAFSDSKRRPKVIRSFTILEKTAFYYSWDKEFGALESLSKLCANVSYLGTSANLVKIEVVTEIPKGSYTFVPNSTGPYNFRGVDPFLFERLVETHNQKQVVCSEMAPRGGDPNPTMVRYCCIQNTEKETILKPCEKTNLRIFNLTKKIPLDQISVLMEALWGTLHKVTEGKAPEFITGHTLEGAQSTKDHLGFVPLANVTHEYATGEIFGVAGIIPKSFDLDQQVCAQRMLDLLHQQILRLGSKGTSVLQNESAYSTKKVLKEQTWVAESKVWASVTPVLLPRYPNAKTNCQKRNEQMCALVRDVCTHSNLPQPKHIQVFEHQSYLAGVPNPKQFKLLNKHDAKKPAVHVLIEFEKPISGPVVLGAGRYRGLGMCCPLPEVVDAVL